MMAAIFGGYAALIWLVFAKLRLVPLTLPIAIVLAAVGPLFAFYIILSMNNYHPSSTDARVFQRVVQITPHITVPGRVQSVVARANTSLAKGDVLFTIDPRPFEFEVNRLEAALAAAAQSVPQLKATLDQASAGVERADVQLNLAQANFDRQSELFRKGDIAQAALDSATSKPRSRRSRAPKRRSKRRSSPTNRTSVMRTPRLRRRASSSTRRSTILTRQPSARPATATRRTCSSCPARSSAQRQP
jgi:multidrug resistance efflux pump